MGNPQAPSPTSRPSDLSIDAIQPLPNSIPLANIDNQQASIPNHDAQNSDPEPSAPTPPTITTSLVASLYTSHFLSTWNSRLFEFGAILFLASIYQTALRPMSIYALVRGASAILFSPAVGLWIDRGNRLSVVRASIVGQRLAVAATCAVFLVMVTRLDMGTGAREGLFAVVIVLACVEKLGAVMNLVAVERDWVVVITENDEAARRTMNARMRRIDLFCKLVGPLVMSLINGASSVVAIWTTLGMSVLSVLVEYICIARESHFALRIRYLHAATKNQHRTAFSEKHRKPTEFQFVLALSIYHLDTDPHQIPPPFYFRHPALLPSFSLSLLYLTVLSFSGPMITFLLFSGYNSFHIGIARTVSTIFELSATWIAPRLSKRIGAVRSSLWFLNCELLWLTGGLCWYLARYYRDPRESMVVTTSGLVAAVAVSRVGLWGFDLCVQGIVQDRVDLDHHGSFSAVEASFQNLFELLSYVSTIIFARPDQFQWPSIMSLGAVYVAMGLFMRYARRERGHLLYRPPCFDVKV